VRRERSSGTDEGARTMDTSEKMKKSCDTGEERKEQQCN